MPRFSRRSKRRLATCDPRLQRLFNRIIDSVDCTILEGHRGEAKQEAAYRARKSNKRWPNGKHNAKPSKAVDVAPYPVDWDNYARFYMFAGYVRAIAEEMGIRLRIGADWDGDWETRDQTLNDLVHFELLD